MTRSRAIMLCLVGLGSGCGDRLVSMELGDGGETAEGDATDASDDFDSGNLDGLDADDGLDDSNDLDGADDLDEGGGLDLPEADDPPLGPSSGFESFEGIGTLLWISEAQFASGVTVTDASLDSSFLLDCIEGGGFYGSSCEDLVFPHGTAALGIARTSNYDPFVEIVLPGTADHVRVAVAQTDIGLGGSEIVLEVLDARGVVLDQTSFSEALPANWSSNVLSLDAPDIASVRLSGPSAYLFDALEWTSD